MTRELLAAFRWRDALDIALVAVVVYRGLLMFQGTRTVQMLAGVGVLAAVWVLARHLELWGITWLLDTFWSFGALALVVVFQPELRRALGRLGQGRLWLSLTGARWAERAALVDEIVKAARTLAARRIGALVVLERTGGLRAYAELGVPLDALVSADLLEAVFLPASPLHDGAVLIQGQRAAAAACFLPLSRAAPAGRALGTRHRAALGIAEETDAVAVVVSEETGRVAIAVDGDLEYPPDVEALRRRLTELVGAPPAAAPAPARRAVRWRLGA
jgi:diadenylate cyclase